MAYAMAFVICTKVDSGSSYIVLPMVRGVNHVLQEVWCTIQDVDNVKNQDMGDVLDQVRIYFDQSLLENYYSLVNKWII